MTLSDEDPSIQPLPIAPLPPYRRLFGPITQGRLVRLLLLYLVLLAIGATLAGVAENERFRIIGLGLVMPGGGFLAHADVCSANGFSHIGAAVIALAVFAMSLVLWFGTGNILAPPGAWLGTAVAAASMNHGAMAPGAAALVYGIAGTAVSLACLAMGGYFLLARRQRSCDNAYLAAAKSDVAAIFSAPPAGGQPEMSLEHLQRLRFALDRALQPIDAFDGFERRDQFQTAATRYQLNFLAYGVALSQARYTPACGTYLHAAQIALLDKQRQHRVWKYWRLENLWGNLRSDPDPGARENIMFTGFVALQMALFSGSTGRSDFNQAGRFTLSHPNGQHYAYDAPALVASMRREFTSSPFHLVACEPNWIYPLCNSIGANAMLALDAQLDAQHGARHWAAQAQTFRHHLETEFLDGFGRYIPCRSARTGLPFPALGGVMPLAMPCFFLHALAPDLARRQWLLLRRGLFDAKGVLRPRAFWPVDTGNYAFSRASAYAATALAAAELGDETVYGACMDSLEGECPSVLKDGVIHRPKASVWAHGVELMARAGQRDAFKTIITAPCLPCVTSGPRLEKLAYPAVLVASAHADAGRLRAVLYPGIDEGKHAIGLAGLVPGATYRVEGASAARVTADSRGEAALTVMLAGRTVLTADMVP